MNTTITAIAAPVQQDSETSMSAHDAGISRFKVTEISVQEQLARLAYVMWQHRDCPEGSADEDWLEAERQVRKSPNTSCVEIL